MYRPFLLCSLSAWLSVLLTQAHHLESSSSLSKRQTAYDAAIVIDAEADNHAQQFHKYLSRPDIEAPIWDVRTYDQDAVSPGYWFVGPYQSARQKKRGGAWVGPHIYDGNGELVWSGVPLLNGFNAFDFKPGRIGDQDVLTMNYRHHHGLILDNHYQFYKEIYRTEGQYNQHDFSLLENGANGTNALVMNTRPQRATRKESRAIGFDGKCRATYDGFEEQDLATGEVVFSWNAHGHIGLDESAYHTDNPVKERCASGAWDFMHGNSIDKFLDGDYLLSARHTSTLYRISGKDGSIVWRLGGRKSDFKFNDKFSGQHDSRIMEDNSTHTIISVLDNAISDNIPETTNPYSRGLLISLRTDVSPMTAEVISHYDHPRGDYSHGRGSLQILPNGNAFCGWAQYSLHSEYKENGELIMEASLKPELKSYRSYKFPWVGHPTAPPDVYSVAVPNNQGSTTTAVYVSWNGATEVATWNLYKATPDEAVELIASTPRRGFESTLIHDAFASYVVAEAVSFNGTVLGRSAVTKTNSPSTSLLDPVMLREQNWIQNYRKGGSQSAVPVAVFAFACGFVACAAAALLGFGIWRCVLRRRKQTSQPYEPVLEDDVEGSTFVDESDDGDEKNGRVKVYDG